jgi:phosphoribosylglycinamide formyltransferase-1
MSEEFISEAIRPVAGTLDTGRMAAGGPGLPRQFEWRSQVVTVVRTLNVWRETGPCHHGSDERYVRKHWFEVLTDSGTIMKIYFERQPRSANKRKDRWWLFSIENGPRDDTMKESPTP